MRFVLLFLFPLLSAQASPKRNLLLLTANDISILSKDLGKRLRKCRQLRHHPDVVVSLENTTEEIVDKTRISGLIQAEVEGKTLAVPRDSEPQFEIQATLSSYTRVFPLAKERIYRLKAEVVQSGETLCKKEAKLRKRSALGK